MDALSERASDGPTVTFTVITPTAPASVAPVPSMEAAAHRALRDDLLRAADSAHWAGYLDAERLLRAMAEWVEEHGR